MEKEKICNFCQNDINLEKDKFVLLGTYHGDNVLDESYFHWKCFNEWYNSKIIEKTKNTIQDATKKVAGMFGNLRTIGVMNDGQENVVDLSAEIPNMEDEIPVMDFNFSDPVPKKKKDDKRKKR